MARSHAKILASIWSDPDFIALTDGAQHAYFMLLSQPKLTVLGTLDYMPTRWVRNAQGLTHELLERRVMELEAANFVIVDHVTEELFIRTLAKTDLDSNRANGNLLKGLWSAWNAIISDALRERITTELPEWLWITDKCDPPDSAVHMRRSARLEPGSDSRSEPEVDSRFESPVSSLLSFSRLSPVSRQAVATGGQSEPSDAKDERDGGADPVIAEAIEKLGQLDYEKNTADRTDIRSPAKFLASCIKSRWETDGDEVAQLRAEHPDWTAEDLAIERWAC